MTTDEEPKLYTEKEAREIGRAVCELDHIRSIEQRKSEGGSLTVKFSVSDSTCFALTPQDVTAILSLLRTRECTFLGNMGVKVEQ
jgi:hypothetical protein